MREGFYLIVATGLALFGYLFGALTPAQLDTELASWFGASEHADLPSVWDGIDNDGPEVVEVPYSAPPIAADAPPLADEPAPPQGGFDAAVVDPLIALQRAAESGDMQSQFDLAVKYDYGDDVPQDDEAAARWYQLAAEQGHAAAQNDLGYMYDTGQGVPEDDYQAAEWYRQAADQGLALAQNNLGILYENGRGVMRDDAEAARWYRLAADQGLHDSQHSLGNLYNYGRGVTQSDEEALRWYSLAVDGGSAEANNSLAWLLATKPNPAVRDGVRAVKAAEQAVALEPENSNYIDTLAAAYAEAGRFDDALATQERALSLLAGVASNDTIADYESRRDLYRSRQPARQ